MNEPNSSEFAAWEAQVDRLASGDLPADERAELFRWLEAEPSRWRRCALALLEARELEQAMGQWLATDDSPCDSLVEVRGVGGAAGRGMFERGKRMPPSPVPAKSAPKSDEAIIARDPSPASSKIEQPRRSAFFSMAAAVLLAFGLGIVLRSQWNSPGATESRGVTANGAASRADSDSETGAVPSTSDRRFASAMSQPKVSAVSDYARGRLERRGFHVETNPTDVPVTLPDGRRVMAHANRVRLEYVGHRSY